jgi:hypothetical protein
MTDCCCGAWLSRAALSVLVASLLGCGSVPIGGYGSRPLPAVSPLPGASGATVAVEVQDARPVPSRVLTDALEVAITRGIAARGFQSGAGGPTLRTIIEHHYFDSIGGFWGPTASSEIVARVQVVAPAGDVRFEKRVVGASGRVKGSFPNVKTLAEMKAYDDLLGALLGDAELSAALVASR